jgi:anti-anti-sigma regulatory factor
MLTVNIEKIGEVAVIRCEGRIVQSAAAFRLREVVRQQRTARVVLLDLSAIQSLEGGGLGMLVFLQRWADERGIQFKLFDPPPMVRQRLGRIQWASKLTIAGNSEVSALLGEGRKCRAGMREKKSDALRGTDTR